MPNESKRPTPEAAVEAVRRRSSHKRDLVRGVLADTVRQGRLLSKADVRRRAGVSKDLVDAMDGEYAAAMAQITEVLTGGSRSSAEVTAASLRAQLDQYKELHKRAEKRADAAERRLGVLLGQQMTGEVVMTTTSLNLADEALLTRISELEAEVGTLSNTAQTAQAELARVRKVNTQLMRQKNTSRPAGTDSGASATTGPARG